MENKNILLTYKHKDGYDTFGWFEDMEDCNDFVESYLDDIIIEIYDCVDCFNYRDMMNELHWTKK
jgi:hypothetical protein